MRVGVACDVGYARLYPLPLGARLLTLYVDFTPLEPPEALAAM
jgi:hypothetical protein